MCDCREFCIRCFTDKNISFSDDSILSSLAYMGFVLFLFFFFFILVSFSFFFFFTVVSLLTN